MVGTIDKNKTKESTNINPEMIHRLQVLNLEYMADLLSQTEEVDKARELLYEINDLYFQLFKEEELYLDKASKMNEEFVENIQKIKQSYEHFFEHFSKSQTDGDKVDIEIADIINKHNRNNRTGIVHKTAMSELYARIGLGDVQNKSELKKFYKAFNGETSNSSKFSAKYNSDLEKLKEIIRKDVDKIR